MFGVTRMIPAVRALARPIQRQAVQTRNMGGRWLYRDIAKDTSPRQLMKADVVATLMWYWLLWHFYYDWDHFYGHGRPDPSKWTDEELGIPADDYD